MIFPQRGRAHLLFPQRAGARLLTVFLTAVKWPVDFPRGENRMPEVQLGSKRLVFLLQDFILQTGCSAKRQEMLIVFPHFCFPNASTILGPVPKATLKLHVGVCFFLDRRLDQGLNL